MPGSVELKVTPETMVSMAEQIRSEVSSIEREFQGLDTIVAASAGYWEGDASSRHQKYYKDIQGDMQDVLKRLMEHPTDLLKMADLYVSGEEKAVQIANALPKDVIS